MQVLSSLKTAKTRHPKCKVVRRHGVVYVICKENPRFKARQGGKKKKRYLGLWFLYRFCQARNMLRAFCYCVLTISFAKIPL